MTPRLMKSRLVLTYGLLCATICATSALSQSRPQTDSDIILAAEHAWAQAAVDRDIATFAKYMSDEYVLIEMSAGKDKQPNWDVTTKSAWVEKIRSRREKYDSVEVHNLKVILNGDTATVTGGYSQKGTTDGKDNSAAGLYVDTWVKRKGQWQLVNSVFP